MAPSQAVENRHQLWDGSVVPGFAAYMLEGGLAVGRDDKGAAKLPGVTLDFGLPETAAHCPPDMAGAAYREGLGHASAQTSSSIGLHLWINPEVKGNCLVFSESLGLPWLAIPDYDESHAPATDLLVRIAQLRDLLAAEQSPKVANEDEKRRLIRPGTAKADGYFLIVDELDVR
jgi:hypothetical protein